MDPSEVTVLVVEDDEFTRMATIDILKSCRYTVFAVEDGSQALQLLMENHGKYDLILCDVMLPVMNGIELLDELAKRSNILGHIPVVMTSSNEEMDVVTSCLSKGAKDYLIKPIQVNTAKTLVRHVWLSRRQEKTSSRSLWKDLEVIRTIGKGTHGTVVLARRKMDGAVVAVKRVRLSQISENGKKQADNEVILLKSLYHVNIVRFYDHFTVDDELNIVMEYSDGGNLRQLVKMRSRENMGPFPEAVIMCWFAQLVLAVAYIHGKNVLHRDLKAQNVFLTRKNVVKLGDFGISKALAGDDTATTACGTPESMSPEICRGEPYGKKSDIWSLGCILYEMIMLKRPFEASTLPDIFTKICKGDYPPVLPTFSRELRLLVRLMLQQDSSKRPAIEDICRFPFVQAPIQAFLSEHVAEFQEALELEAKLHQPSLYSTGPGNRAVAPISPSLRRRGVGAGEVVERSSPPITSPAQYNAAVEIVSPQQQLRESVDLGTPASRRFSQDSVVTAPGSTGASPLQDNNLRNSAIAGVAVGLSIDSAPSSVVSNGTSAAALSSGPPSSVGTGVPGSKPNSAGSWTDDSFGDELRCVVEVADTRVGFFSTHSACISGFDLVLAMKKHFQKTEQEAMVLLQQLMDDRVMNLLTKTRSSSITSNEASTHTSAASAAPAAPAGVVQPQSIAVSCSETTGTTLDDYLCRPDTFFRFQVDEVFQPLNMKYVCLETPAAVTCASVMDICLQVRECIAQLHASTEFPRGISMGYLSPAPYGSVAGSNFGGASSGGVSVGGCHHQGFGFTIEEAYAEFHKPECQKYRRFLKQAALLQQIDLDSLSKHERQAFFINLYNTMVLHGFIAFGIPRNVAQYRAFEKDVTYVIGQQKVVFSLGDIKHGILRCNRKPPANYWERQLQSQDARLQFRLHIRDPRSLLVLIDCCEPVPNHRDVLILKPGRTDTDLEDQVEKFCAKQVEIDQETKEIRLPRVFRVFRDDFGPNETEMVSWLSQYINDVPSDWMNYRVKYQSGISC